MSKKAPSIQKYSYGILLFTGEKDEKKYLLVQNRDSESFIYFFLAWNIDRWSNTYMMKVVSGFSRDELNRLLYYSFQILYTDLYVNHVKGTFQKQLKRAMYNYNYFHSRKDWIRMCHDIKQTCEIKWGFSKGRIETSENPHKCALRELHEEVGLVEDDIQICSNLNSIHYKNEKALFNTVVNVCLFPAQCNNELPIHYQKFDNTIRCVSVSNEILHARWATIQESFFLLPEYLYRILYEFHIDLNN